MLSRPAKRDLKHNRVIEGKGYKRDDGLWDVEVFLVDSKTYSFENMHRGYISAGEPLHDMAVRLTLNDERKIIKPIFFSFEDAVVIGVSISFFFLVQIYHP